MLGSWPQEGGAIHGSFSLVGNVGVAGVGLGAWPGWGSLLRGVWSALWAGLPGDVGT